MAGEVLQKKPFGQEMKIERPRGSVVGPEVQRLAGCLYIAWRQRVFDWNASIKRTDSDIRQCYHSSHL